MSWSDAIRAEAGDLDREDVARPAKEFHRSVLRGRTPWRERSLVWILGLASVRADDAQKILSDLRAAFLPLHRISKNLASRSAD